MSTGRRVFFALWPDDRVRDALLRWQLHNLPHEARRQHRDDLHMTLSFLGNVEQQQLAGLFDLAAELPASAFSLVLDQIGYWRAPQVLWAGPSSAPGALIELQDRLTQALLKLGFSADDRPYRPHVTLARRVRSEASAGPLLPVTWQVQELALLESLPGAPPHYRVLFHRALM